MIQKLLIANRGEIACRIIRTAKKMGIATVAIYSEADANALHTQMADEAFLLGEAPAQVSYLNIPKIIEIAKQSKADAIHPGYGFLAENEDFAKAVEEANIIFVGPPSHVIEAMGSKSAAKKLMEKAHVPIIPGYHGDEQADAIFKSFCEKIGFPILLKPSAGGGGKGMRVVKQMDDLTEALASARREALSSFNNENLILEKYLETPRHIEMQIFADRHGNVIHLFERDCSIQRRHQKIIEEAPAFLLSDSVKKALAKSAVQAAKAIGYIGAGTIEFLVDPSENYYFMEMNTRLQVEHPVTEMITGIDLVEWQLKIASGEPLPCTQHQIVAHGHAIEARIYAENPKQLFLPSPGKISVLRWPEENEHLRIDTGVRENDHVSQYYDPLIAKMIAWGEDRTQAYSKLLNALQDTHIVGVHTNIDFIRKTLKTDAYQKGEINTYFLDQNESNILKEDTTIPDPVWGTLLLYQLLNRTTEKTPWQQTNAWQMNLPASEKFSFYNHQTLISFDALHEANQYKILKANHSFYISGHKNKNEVSLQWENEIIKAYVYDHQSKFHIFGFDQLYEIQKYNPNQHYSQEQFLHPHFNAPMPGTIVAIPVKSGDMVKQGDTLIIMEAMKMEHRIKAPEAGKIIEIFFKVGDKVNEGSELLRFEGKP